MPPQWFGSKINPKRRKKTKLLDLVGLMVGLFFAGAALALASPAMDRTSPLRPRSQAALSSEATADKDIKLVVLATASVEEAKTHSGNVAKLARGIDGTRVVLYAINAIDNKVNPWHGWKQATEKIGIAAMVEASHRSLERGFTSKLVSQLPLLDLIKGSVSFDYVWTIDGDISLLYADLNGLFNLLRSSRPLIAQPTIRAATGEYSWGSQFFKPFNDGYPLKCHGQTNGTQAHDSPMIESQAAILSETFLNWYDDELKQVAKLQQYDYQCDWGHDEMWCSGAARLSKELSYSRPACLILQHSVDHLNSHEINKWASSDGSSYYAECQKFEDALEADKQSHSADPGRKLRVYSPPPHVDIMVPIPNCTACGGNWCGANDVCASFGLEDGRYVRGPDLDAIGCNAVLASKGPYCLDGGQDRFAVYRGPAGNSASAWARSNVTGSRPTSRARSKGTGLSANALQDHTTVLCANQWADSWADSKCTPPTVQNAAIESYRAFVQAGCSPSP